jgi:hypothetical protein
MMAAWLTYTGGITILRYFSLIIEYIKYQSITILAMIFSLFKVYENPFSAREKNYKYILALHFQNKKGKFRREWVQTGGSKTYNVRIRNDYLI